MQNSTIGQNELQQWIEVAKTFVDADDDYCLINVEPEYLQGTVTGIWERWLITEETSELDAIRGRVLAALEANPQDTAARFVALNLFFRLSWHDLTGTTEQSLEKQIKDAYSGTEEPPRIATFRSHCIRYLSDFIKLRSVSDCVGRRTIRWEITNAAAIRDCDRALHLFERLKDFATEFQYHNCKGQFLFQFLFSANSAAFKVEPDLESWLTDYHDGVDRPQESIGYRRTNSLLLSIAPTETSVLSGEYLYRANLAAIELGMATETATTPTDYVLLCCMVARSWYAAERFRDAAFYYRVALNLASKTGFIEDVQLPAQGLFESWVYRSLASACEAAGLLDDAATAIEEWAIKYPADAGHAYSRLARAAAKLGRYDAVVEYLKKQSEIEPQASEDWKTSTILALGSIANLSNSSTDRLAVGLDRLDQVIDPLKQLAPLATWFLQTHWPVFRSISKFAQDRFVKGSKLFGLGFEAEGALSFAVAVEKELNLKVFWPYAKQFREEKRLVPTARAVPEWIRKFRDLFYKDNCDLTLGVMFLAINESAQELEIREFQEWLRHNNPKIFDLRSMDTKCIVNTRNKQSHLGSVNKDEAERASAQCRSVIDTLYAK